MELLKGMLWQGCLREAKEPGIAHRWAAAGIKSVISVLFEEKPRFPPDLPALFIPVREDVPTPPGQFDAACAFHRAFPGTFIHCVAGANRSRVFAAALLVGVHGMGVDEALRLADPPPNGRVFDSFKDWALAGARRT